MSDTKTKLALEELGTFQVKITDAEIIKHPFKQDEDGAFSVKVEAGKKVEGKPHYGYCYLHIDSDYLPSNMQREGVETTADKTFHTLAVLGVPGNGMELSAVKPTLKGQTVEFFGKKNASGYLNYYINLPGEGGRNDEVVDAKSAQDQIAALYGAGAKSDADETGAPPVDENEMFPGDDLDELPM